ncbi:MarR family winged helix-turn-helix transcriptional regulator [Winogradskya humida]|nr:MarR family winged helix-turn-helix transcriptional regulator [Actinoplanes humidus]
MDQGSARTPATSLSFRLGVLGAMAEARWAGRIAGHGVKPKHVALLSSLRLGAADSQLELAATLRVAPSLVVLLADQLETLGAVSRERDPGDRRRQRLVLTAVGERLLDDCVGAADALDEELVTALSATERAALTRILGKLAGAEGLPV